MSSNHFASGVPAGGGGVFGDGFSGVARNKRRRGLGSNPLAPPIRATDEVVLLGGGEKGAGAASAAGTGAGAGAAPPFLLRHSLYFCAYCNKDISSVPRVRCAECGVSAAAKAAGREDTKKNMAASSSNECYDSCVECFAAGAALSPHRPGHAYRVVDDLSFPLFDPKWGADEEVLLLEGISMFGLGSWGAVADHVNAGGVGGGGGGGGASAAAAAAAANNCSNDAAIAAALAAGTTPAFPLEQQQLQQKNPGFKDAAACARHYFEAYLSSPDFPRPAPLPSLTAAKAVGGGAAGGNGVSFSLPRRSSSKPPRDKEEEEENENFAEGNGPSSAEKAKEDGRGGSAAVKREEGEEEEDRAAKAAMDAAAATATKLQEEEEDASKPDESQQQPKTSARGAASRPSKFRSGGAVAKNKARTGAGAGGRASFGAAAASAAAAAAVRNKNATGKNAKNASSPGGASAAAAVPVTPDPAGFHAKRYEHDPEFDNDAELLISEIEFRDDDPPEATADKLRAIETYNRRLDERERRRAFVASRGLTDGKKLSSEDRRRPPAERELASRLRCLTRNLAPGRDAEALAAGVLHERRLRARISELKEARLQGARTLADADLVADRKRRRQAAANAAANASGGGGGAGGGGGGGGAAAAAVAAGAAVGGLGVGVGGVVASPLLLLRGDSSSLAAAAAAAVAASKAGAAAAAAALPSATTTTTSPGGTTTTTTTTTEPAAPLPPPPPPPLLQRSASTATNFAKLASSSSAAASQAIAAAAALASASGGGTNPDGRTPATALGAWRARMGLLLDITQLPGVEKLSKEERAICATSRMLPVHYLAAKAAVMCEARASAEKLALAAVSAAKDDDSEPSAAATAAPSELLVGSVSRDRARELCRLDAIRARRVLDHAISRGWAAIYPEDKWSDDEEAAKVAAVKAVAAAAVAATEARFKAETQAAQAAAAAAQEQQKQQYEHQRLQRQQLLQQQQQKQQDAADVAAAAPAVAEAQPPLSGVSVAAAPPAPSQPAAEAPAPLPPPAAAPLAPPPVPFPNSPFPPPPPLPPPAF